jgi:hypothetical protein
MVRAKYRVDALELTKGYGKDGKPAVMTSVKMNPVMDTNPESENGKFFASTPGGEMRMATVNPSAAEYFELGKEYYLDFSKVQ